MNHGQFMWKPGRRGRLADFDPGFTANFEGEREAVASMERDCAALAKYQDVLMAHETYGLLILFQAMDGAGKDSTIKHVMSSLDPQGCEVKMFKKATEKEARHDYLWRAALALPARGQVGIFNRSYYENLLSDRLEPDNLEAQHLPAEAKGRGLWAKRYRHVNNFEQYLTENGIRVLKFFLHLSADEQRERLLERLTRPEKKWKFSMKDVENRGRWGEHMRLYEEVFRRTSTRWAPWYIIPADHRWFTRAAVASIVAAELKSLHSRYPVPDARQRKEMAKAQRVLEREGGPGGR